MKRIATIIAVTICFLAIGSLSYAQQGGKGKGIAGAAQGANFVDNDGDGICDNAGARMGRGRGNGKGLAGTAQGANFVDNDGDGICVNAGARMGRGRGFRRNNVRGNGTAQGPNFVDKDGDGVCDNYQQVQQQD
ncbi:MAG: hypothetical protein PVG39_01850 [Desulfobacteraceae bacterium]|jgi:hypothetical protein